jgi:adenine-specific DNA-methyltransferase
MTIGASPLQSIQTPDLLQERLARLKDEFPDLFTNEGQLNPAELLRLTGQQGREHFDFQWWGKSEAKRKAFTPTTAALRYDEARSVNPDRAGGNAIIEGENLEVLKLLLCAYRGQVKCIYIDPPYNTGNDFVYKDNFKEGERAYWEQTGVTEGGVKTTTNTRAEGRFHSHWLNMIYPRLLVARQLLREDGVIFVSIDDNEVTHLRKVMDEVFGEECLLGCVTLLCNPKGRSQDKYFATNHEYIVAYSKTVLPKGALSVAKQVMQIQTDYPEVDEDGERFRYLELRNTHREFGKHNRKNLYYPFYVKPNGDVCLEPLVNAQAIFPDWEDGFQGCWTWEKKKAVSDLKLLAARKVKDRWKIYRKSYAEGSERMLKTIFADSAFYTSTGQREFNQIFESKEKFFQSPKSPLLIKELLDVSCDEKELVLDFFAGSGSLFHAALMSEKKRQVISVQISEVTDYKSEAHKAGFKKISDITIERVKRVIQGYGDNPQPIDAGFKVFTLQKSAFPRADFAPDPEANEVDQLAALKAFIADKEASLFNTLDAQAVRDEVLLKCGFQLDVQLTPIAEVTANQLYRAREEQTTPREAIVCFESHIDTTTIEWLCQQKGQRVIVLEAALDTTGKWNLHHQLGDGLVVF